MILVSSFEIKRNEVVPLYYMRQTVEKLIGFAKAEIQKCVVHQIRNSTKFVSYKDRNPPEIRRIIYTTNARENFMLNPA